MDIAYIKKDSLIDLKISSGFYERLFQLFLFMINNQDPVVVKSINDRILKDEELDEWGEHYKTMLCLVSDIEEAAKDQEKVDYLPFPS